MGLLLPSSYRNPLAYPAGVAPGFDPSHVAGQNVRFSAVLGAGNAINLAPGLVGAGVVGTVNGSPTFPIDGVIGPTIAPATGAYITFASGTQTASLPNTLAAIVFNPSGVNAGIFTNYTSGSSGVGLCAFSGSLHFVPNSSEISSGLLIGSNEWCFVAASCIGNSSTINFVIANLRTGAVRTATATAGTSMGAGNQYSIGKEFEYGTTYNSGRIAAVMHSTTALGLPQLRQWAADPWSFWYPQRRSYNIAAQVSAGVLYTQLERGIRGLNRGVYAGGYR